jgi:flagellar hook-associated protein FlgK
MSNLFQIGKSTLLTAQKVTEMISHNVANSNTPGYKKLVEHNQEVTFGKQLAGVTTSIGKSGDIFLDRRVAYAIADSAEAQAYTKGLEILHNTVITKGAEEAFSAFMNSAHDLNINSQDIIRQEAFKQAGQTFSTQLKGLGSQLESAKGQLEELRDLEQIQLESLQKAMSAITAGPVTDEAKDRLASLQNSVMEATKSIAGYNKVLNGVIPSVNTMFTTARTEVIDGTNNSYGQNIIDADGGFTFDANNIGDVKSLTEFGSQKFNKDMGRMLTSIGAQLNGASQISGSAYDALAGALQAQKDATGVDITEQTIKALQYQRMYEAGAKLIQVENEMLGTLLNIVA